MKLHSLNVDPTKHRQKYCGPSIISILCGISTQDAALLIRKKFKKQSVKGTSTEQVLYVLKLFGYKTEYSFGTVNGKYHIATKDLRAASYRATRVCKSFHKGTDPTLTKWFEWHRAAPKDNEAYLVICGCHWMVEHQGLMHDNANPSGVPVSESRKKQCKVVLTVKLTQRDVDTSKVLARIERYNASTKKRTKERAKVTARIRRRLWG